MDIRDEALDSWTEQTLGTLDATASWQPDAAAGLARFRAGRPRAVTSLRWPVVLAAAVVLFLSLPIVGGARGLAARCIEACVQLLSRSAPAPPAQLRAADVSEPFIEPAARQPAPDFAFDDVLGRAVRSSSLRNRVVLLNFWATWCPPCKVEIPWFADLDARDAGRGLSVVGIAMEEDGVAPVRAFVEEHQMHYAVGLGDQQVGRAYGGVDKLPTTFLLDRQGRIAGRLVGLTSQAVYEAAVERLLGER